MLGIHLADETEQWSCYKFSLKQSILFDKYIADVFQTLPVHGQVHSSCKGNNLLNKSQEE
jgi:hypothetical protein